MPITPQIFRIKMMFNWRPTGEKNAGMRQPITRCSMCNHFESHDHPIFCKDVRRQSLFAHHMDKLRHWMSTSIDPEFASVIYSIIIDTHKKERHLPTSYKYKIDSQGTTPNGLLRDLTQEILNIGSMNFLRGFIPLSIRKYIVTTKRIRNTQWTSKLVNKLHACQYDCWLQRNKHLHEQTYNHMITIDEENDTSIKISQLYFNLKSHQINHPILSKPLEQRQNETTKTKKDWIDQLEPIVRQLQKIRSTKLDKTPLIHDSDPRNQSQLRQNYPQSQLGRPPDYI